MSKIQAVHRSAHLRAGWFGFPYNFNETRISDVLEYTTLIKQPRIGNLSKSLPIVNMKISSPDSDLAPKL